VEVLLVGVGTLSGVQRLEVLCMFAVLSVLVNYVKTRLCAGAALRRDSLNIYGALSNWGAVVELDGSSIRIDGRFLCRARGGRAIVR